MFKTSGASRKNMRIHHKAIVQRFRITVFLTFCDTMFGGQKPFAKQTL